MAPTVSLVLPTFNRLDALETTLPSTLAVAGVQEVLCVDDGSTDSTVDYLRSIDDPRVRVLALEHRSGQPAVRNRGAVEATGEWLVFGEDDCCLPPDYVTTMLAEAAIHGADVVGAPWVWTPGAPHAATVAEARRTAIDSVRLDQVERFPARTLNTPFLPALALVSRRVFDAGIWFDEGLHGNAYREETSFFVSAARAGFKTILTPHTYSWQAERWPGGAHLPRWRYELSSIRNNGRFLRRHGRWMQQQGFLGEPWAAQARFTAERLAYVESWYRWHALRRLARAAGLR